MLQVGSNSFLIFKVTQTDKHLLFSQNKCESRGLFLFVSDLSLLGLESNHCWSQDSSHGFRHPICIQSRNNGEGGNASFICCFYQGNFHSISLARTVLYALLQRMLKWAFSLLTPRDEGEHNLIMVVGLHNHQYLQKKRVDIL